MFTMISLTKSIHQVFEVLGDRKYLKKKKKLSYFKFRGWREGRDIDPYNQEFGSGG